MNSIKIRIAEKKDLPKIVEIYNQAIPSQQATADTKLFDVEQKTEWFKNHLPDKYPIFVVELAAKVIGWNSLSPYRGGREALRHTLETSYYIDKNYQKRGIGSALIKYVIDNAAKYNVKTLLTFIMAHNKVSIKLMDKFGFEQWGKLPDVADFDGKEFSHFIFGKRIK